MKGNDVLATNQLLYFLVLGPIGLIIYTILFYSYLRFNTEIGSTIIWNISVIFFIMFPIYIKYSLEIFDKFSEGTRILFFRFKYIFTKKMTNYGKWNFTFCGFVILKIRTRNFLSLYDFRIYRSWKKINKQDFIDESIKKLNNINQTFQAIMKKYDIKELSLNKSINLEDIPRLDSEPWELLDENY